MYRQGNANHREKGALKVPYLVVNGAGVVADSGNMTRTLPQKSASAATRGIGRSSRSTEFTCVSFVPLYNKTGMHERLGDTAS